MAFNGNVGVPGNPNVQGEPMNYTGKNINATSGSRTQNTTDLQIGDILALDPHGHDDGKGSDLANPTTGFLDMPLWVVTDVPPDAKRGGRIKAARLADCAGGVSGVHTKANQTAGVTLLGATDQASASVNQRYLVAVTGSNTNDTLIVIKTAQAISLTTVDTSTTAGRTAHVAPI